MIPDNFWNELEPRLNYHCIFLGPVYDLASEECKQRMILEFILKEVRNWEYRNESVEA